MSRNSASHANFNEIKDSQNKRDRLDRDSETEIQKGIRSAFDETYGTFAAMPPGTFDRRSTIRTRIEAIIAKLAGNDFDLNRAVRLKVEREAARRTYGPAEVAADIARISVAEKQKMDAVFAKGTAPTKISKETRRHLSGLNNRAVNSYWENLHDAYTSQYRRETIQALADPAAFKLDVVTTGVYQNRRRWNVKDAAPGIESLKKLIVALDREKRSGNGLYAAALSKYQITPARVARGAANGYNELETVAAHIVVARYDRATDSFFAQTRLVDRVLKIFDKAR